MAFLKTSNPAFSEKIFQKIERVEYGEMMTTKGTMNKFAFLMLMLLASAAFSWQLIENDTYSIAIPFLIGGAIAAIVLSLIMSFKPNTSPYLAPAYAICKGFVVGIITGIFGNLYNGLVAQAIGLTIGVVAAMYFMYHLGLIKVTQRLKSIIFMATLGIVIFYLIAFALSFFNVYIGILSFTNGSMISIGFSLFVVALASMNLLVCFDNIQNGVTQGVPKYMEWYCAFGLQLTIVWLYIEILRLLSKISSK